jgi:hypothetical protein
MPDVVPVCAEQLADLMLAWLLVASATVRIHMDHKSHGHATAVQVDLTCEFAAASATSADVRNAHCDSASYVLVNVSLAQAMALGGGIHCLSMLVH